MKKIFLTFLIFLGALQAYGFEDYIILSDIKVDSAYSKDENILSVMPFYTIDNGKKILILNAKSEGKTQILIETDNGEINIDVIITDKETILSDVEGITAFPIDFVSGPDKPVLREK